MIRNASHRISARAYTLIEVLVVVVIVGVVLGTVGISLSGAQSRDVRFEAERLALLIQSAQEDALLRNEPVRLQLDRHSYSFWTLNDKGEFAVSKDDLTKMHTLPTGIEFERIAIEGESAAEKSQVVFSQLGQNPAFQLTLRGSTTRWNVECAVNGHITTSNPDA